MKNAELLRVLRAIVNIPLPQDGGGTKTASMKGLYDYQLEMREAVSILNRIINSISYCEPVEMRDIEELEKISEKYDIWRKQ